MTENDFGWTSPRDLVVVADASDSQTSLYNRLELPIERPRHPPADETIISPQAIRQTTIQDCFFQAALASLANTTKGQKAIERMISANADGTHSVKFPGIDETILVSQKDIDEASSSNKEPWAVLLETAFLKYNMSGGAWHSLLSSDGVGPLGRVRTTREAIKLLTGDSVGVSQFTPTDLGNGRLTLGEISKANIEQQLLWGKEHQSLMTAGASMDFSKWLGENSPSPLPTMHVFSVLDYDPEKKSITVFNPWGHNADLGQEGDTTNGITNLGRGKLQMSLDKFMETFGDLNVSGRSDGRNLVDNLATDYKSMPANFRLAANQWFDGKPLDASKTILRSVTATRRNIANGVTNYLHTAGGYAVDHPVETFLVPALPLLVTGYYQLKEAKSAAVDQFKNMRRSAF